MRQKKAMGWLLALVLFITGITSNIAPSQASAEEATPLGTVTMTVEKFTLGQGYYLEPTLVPFYEGENGADLLLRAVGEGNIHYGGTVNSGFYMQEVKDPPVEMVIPGYILSVMESPKVRAADDEWLGQLDYSSQAGWMNTINNVPPDVGLSDYVPHDGDVIRNQFTLYGWGSDIFSSQWAPGLIDFADKDDLTTEVAMINSIPELKALLSEPSFAEAYAHANDVLKNLESTQAEVDHALTVLKAGDGIDRDAPELIVTGLTDGAAATTKSIGFQVAATDNVTSGIVPIVTLNGVELTGTNGAYTALLNSGANSIVVSANDEAGNRTEKSFTVLYDLQSNVSNQLSKNLAKIVADYPNPKFGTSGGEWSVLSLARAEYSVPSDYYQTYYQNVINSVNSLMKTNGGVLDKNKSTEHSRLILGLAAAGYKAEDVAGYDITKALSDYDYVIKQGMNGPIYALIAMDTRALNFPQAENGKNQATRDNLISYILDKEINSDSSTGGWALFGTKADVDITGMALQALAPYYGKNAEVTAAVDRAVAWLSSAQNATGGYTSFGSTSSESVAQVIAGLSELGIDSATDARFVKNGYSALDALMAFAVPTGGFKHVLTGNVDGMATDQGTYALVAYERMKAGKTRLYDMSDIWTSDPGGGGVVTPTPTNKVTLSVDKTTIGKGYVIQPSSIDLQAGDTAWSVLKRELDTRGIDYLYKWDPNYSSIYVQSIAGDGEFDHGTGSGWKYNVNGIYPGYGADKYILNNGDIVQWRYTTNLGEDLGENPSQWQESGSGSGTGKDDVVVTIPSSLNGDFTYEAAYPPNKNGKIYYNIPTDSKFKFFLNLKNVKTAVPALIVNKDNYSLAIDYGTKLIAGGDVLEMFTTSDPGAAELSKLVQAELGEGTKLQGISNAFSMGASDASFVFDKPVTLTIKGAKDQQVGFIENGTFTPITIYKSEEQGAYASTGKEKFAYAYVDGDNLIVKTNHFTTYVTYSTLTASEEAYDLKKLYPDAALISAWALDSMSQAAKQGFVQGANGKLNPKTTITRAEFTKLLVSVLGLAASQTKTNGFKDVTADKWFYAYVNTAYQAGFVSGSGDKFNPNDTITREQMASILARALNASSSAETASVADLNQVSSWAKSDVQKILSLQIMKGQGDKFAPKDSVTREMAVVVAMRAYEYRQEHSTGNGSTAAEVQAAAKNQIAATAAFMQKTIADPTVNSIGGEWTVFGLARSGAEVPNAYYEKYLANLEKTLKEKGGNLHSVKYTEYDRVILALTALNKSVTDAAGYNLLEKLADYDTLIKQGINGPIFALIALDSKKYEIPAVSGVKTQTTRELLIDFILNREIAGGGWALGANAKEADADITSMSIQALAPYYGTNDKVRAAIDRGVEWLSKAQLADGGFSSSQTVNSESIAQVVVALTSLGIDPHTDARFVKNGHSALEALLGFAAPNGGFYHIKAGGTSNGGATPGDVDAMATDQAMYALVAYDRLVNGRNRLYDLTDV